MKRIAQRCPAFPILFFLEKSLPAQSFEDTPFQLTPFEKFALTPLPSLHI